MRAELSWVLEDNMPMRRMIEALGAVPYKTYRIYEKALVSDRPGMRIVLAAGRGPGDPMAKAYGVTHKCLIRGRRRADARPVSSSRC